MRVGIALGEKQRPLGGGAGVKKVMLGIDGVEVAGGLQEGGKVEATGEELVQGPRSWRGGVPCLMRGGGDGDGNGEDGWVGGLNGLLKFNYPFGEEEA